MVLRIDQLVLGKGGNFLSNDQISNFNCFSLTPNNLSIPWISTTIRFAKKCWGQGEEDEKEETVFIIPSVVIKSIDFDTLVFIGTPLESNSFPLNVFDYQS